MKKEIIILFVLILHLCSWSQKTIKTSIPCDDNVLFKTHGRWLTAHGGLLDLGSEHLGFNKTQVKEVTTRMDAVHQLMLKIYPQPMAIDAEWHHTIGYGTFGEQVKFVKNSQGILNIEAVKVKPVARFGYVCGFFRYYCNPNNSNEIWPGSPGETGTWLHVFANNIEPAAGIPRTGDPDYPGDLAAVFTIGGYPMRLRHSLNKNLGEFELLSIENYKTRYLIVHRKGMLPYIPVTRKQYLDHCIPYITNWWNNSIKSIEQMPVRTLEEQEAEKKHTLAKMEKDFAGNPQGLKSAVDYYLAGYKTEQQTRDEQKEKATGEKEAALKRYQDELEQTTKDGLLDASAIVPSFFNPLLENTTIFVDEKKGSMVVIENPDYMRKDLPKYVPQFFVVTWVWNEWKPQEDIAKLIEEKLPLDKLQAMLDQ